MSAQDSQPAGDETVARDGAAVPAEDPVPSVGLWSERWFRVLTILNIGLVAASAMVAVASHLGLLADPWALLGFLFPFVPMTVACPILSIGIVLFAAAFSALHMIVMPQKGVRFLRAFTVWGTVALTVPSLLVAIWVLPAMFGSLA